MKDKLVETFNKIGPALIADKTVVEAHKMAIELEPDLARARFSDAQEAYYEVTQAREGMFLETTTDKGQAL